MTTPQHPAVNNPLAIGLAEKIFGYVPSLSVAGSELMLIADARLYMWDSLRDCFVLLMSNPQPDGKVDLQVIPEPIRTRTELDHAVCYADRLFRQSAVLPGQRSPAQWGFEIEDNIVQILRLLGFQDAYGIRDHHRHTVRLGTHEEDHDEKADIVLTMPDPSAPRQGVVVPLQVTVASVKAGSKRDAIASRRVAFLALQRFSPRAELYTLLTAAIESNGIERWYLAQVIRGAIAQFLGRNIRFPVEPVTPPYVRKDPLFMRYLKLLQSQHQDSLVGIWGQPNQTPEYRQHQVTRAIDNLRYIALPYFKEELFQVTILNPT